MPTDNYAMLVERVTAALNTASLQHQVHVSNIANRESEGYARLKVAFDRAIGLANSADGSTSLQSARPYVVRDAQASPVSLEEDLMAMSKNTMNYQALTKALSRYFSIASAISNGGKG